MKIPQILKENEKEFEEKFVGKCPDYHDPNTHSNFPSTWKKKMMNIEELKSFLRSSQTNLIKGLIEEVEGMKKDRGAGKYTSTSVRKRKAVNYALQKVIDLLNNAIKK